MRSQRVMRRRDEKRRRAISSRSGSGRGLIVSVLPCGPSAAVPFARGSYTYPYGKSSTDGNLVKDTLRGELGHLLTYSTALVLLL